MVLAFVNLKNFISERNAVDKICNHIEADMLRWSPAFQERCHEQMVWKNNRKKKKAEVGQNKSGGLYRFVSKIN